MRDTYDRLVSCLVPLDIAHWVSVLLSSILAMLLVVNGFSFWLAISLGSTVCITMLLWWTTKKIIPRLLSRHIVTTLRVQQPSMLHPKDR